MVPSRPLPLFVYAFLLLTPLAVGQQSSEVAAPVWPQTLVAEVAPLATTMLHLAAWPLAEPPQRIAARELGGEFLQLTEQAPSLINLRRTLLERQLDGYPLCAELVRVNWLVDGTLLVHGATSKVHSWSGEDRIGAEYAATLAQQIFTADWPLTVHASRLEILQLVSGARLCHRVDLLSPASTALSFRVWVDAEFGQVWQITDRCTHSNGQAAVFMPNPVETLNDPNLSDQQDSGSAVPAAAYFAVVLEDLDGSGYMTGTWATTAATPNHSFRANLDFSHNRNGRIFEEALSYYHVTTLQHHLQALGLTARRSAQPINVADRLFGFEYANASYNPSNGVISFGTRGIDFAEDADVVIHEYGHAIHDDVQGGLGNGENGAMSEGYGDWLAAAHSDDALVGEWVGVAIGSGGGFPAVRRVDGMKHYPDDQTGEVHDDGEIWAATLWEIDLMLGHDSAMQLILEAMATMAPSSSMPNAANLLVLAEAQLTNGVNLPYVAGPLLRTGLLDLPAGQPLLEADHRGIRAGDVVTFRLTSPTHAGNNFLVVLSRNAVATAIGAPFHTTLAIGSDLLGLSLSMPALSGQLNAQGRAVFSLTVPAHLPWKTAYFAQAMILDSGNAAIAQTPPLALRAERH